MISYFLKIVRRSSDHLWLLLPLLALPALWPFVREGLPRSFDGGLHMLRLAVLDRQIADGVLLPRWVSEMMLGNGYPLFNFYGPGSYYLTELLHITGLDFYHAFIGAFVLAVIIAGLGMYALALEILGRQQRWAALAAATAYMYGPYLLTNVYIRGALAEAMAQALLPWILWSTYRLLRSKEPISLTTLLRSQANALFIGIFALAALAITHTITLLFTPLVLISFAAVLVATTWRSPQTPPRVFWVLLGMLAAMGISAFFWLPLLGERNSLADTALEISKSVWLSSGVWTWQTFLDTGWAFSHSFARPIKLGLVQLGLAVAGFALARPRNTEWLYFGLLALVVSLLISAWALPLWLSSDILAVAQFPWRLLSILSLPLALSAGYLAARPSQNSLHGLAQPLVSLTIITIIVLAHRPQLAWMDVYTPNGIDLTSPALAQWEVDKGVFGGGEGDSAVQEFRPRWADRTLVLTKRVEEMAQVDRATPLRSNSTDLLLSVSAPATATLRLTNFFFPGWQVTLDGDTSLAVQPATNLGLLTVDVPPGEHTLLVEWRGTRLQTLASLISLLTMIGLSGLCLWQPALRRWAWLPLGVLIVATASMVWPHPLRAITAPQQPLVQYGVELVGLQFDDESASDLIVRPYWYVRATPPADLRLRWQVRDGGGALLGEQTGLAYFNSTPLDNWPAGALVDDAAQLPFPPATQPGVYSVAVGLGRDQAELAASMRTVGEVTLTKATSPNPVPLHTMHAQIGESIELTGYDLLVDGALTQTSYEAPALVEAGQYVQIIPYWQAIAPVTENVHGFVHLSDLHGMPIAQEDHSPGPFFSPPAIWQPDRLYPDSYLLRIPSDAASGLVWPQVGLYDFDTVERLPVVVDQRSEVGDHVRLPPIKLIQRSQPAPQHSSDVRVGEWAHLIGYDLQPSAMVLQPGDILTVTLHFRSDTHSPADFTRFVHLFDPTLGMAAQSDGLPQQGANPTWAWTPGEQIVDRVTLQVAADAKPGRYRLVSGFYDAQSGGERVAAFGADGQPLTDNLVILSDVIIEAGDPPVQ